MTTKVTTTLLDDIDGKGGDVQTVSFALDGDHFEIDLRPPNMRAFRGILAQYIPHARIQRPNGKTGNGTRARAGKPAGGNGTKGKAAATARNADVRTWAQARGYEIAPRGRIADHILREFNAERG